MMICETPDDLEHSHLLDKSPEILELDALITTEYKTIWGANGSENVLAAQSAKRNSVKILEPEVDKLLEEALSNSAHHKAKSRPDNVEPKPKLSKPVRKHADLPFHLVHTKDSERSLRQGIEASEEKFRASLFASLLESNESTLKGCWAELIMTEKRARLQLEDVVLKEWHVLLQIRDECERGGDVQTITAKAANETSQSEREEALQNTVAILRSKNEVLEQKLKHIDTAENVALQGKLRLAEATIAELRAEIRSLHLISTSSKNSLANLRRKETDNLLAIRNNKPATPRLHLGALTNTPNDAYLEEQLKNETESRQNRELAKSLSMRSKEKSTAIPPLDMKPLTPGRSPPEGDTDLSEQLTQEHRSRSNKQMAKNASMRLAPIGVKPVVPPILGTNPVPAPAPLADLDNHSINSYTTFDTESEDGVVCSPLANSQSPLVGRPMVSILNLRSMRDEDVDLEEQIGMEHRSRSNRQLAKHASVHHASKHLESSHNLTPRLPLHEIDTFAEDEDKGTQLAMEERSRSNRSFAKRQSLSTGNLSPVSSMNHGHCPVSPRGR